MPPNTAPHNDRCASLPNATADLQWRDARVVGHMRMFNGELRWIIERPDGTQHRVVAVAVQEDWQTPIPHGGFAALVPSDPCLRCQRCAGCHAPHGDCPVPNTSCATGTCPQEPGPAAHPSPNDGSPDA